VTFGTPGQERIAQDETGQLLAFCTEAATLTFAQRLSWRTSIPTQIRPLSASHIGAILVAAGRDETALTLVEAQAVDADDGVAWARELADRVPIVPVDGSEGR
jgi:hypothetical protein